MVLVLPLIACWTLVACPGPRSDANGPSRVAVQSSPPEAPPGPDATPDELGGAAKATPGFVACGSQTCDLAVAYCALKGEDSEAVWTCVPKGQDFDPERMDSRTLLCDDASDCGPGTVCCMQAGGGGEPYVECAPPPCSVVQVCIPNGPCPSGQRCVKDGTFGTGNSCQPADPGASCGPKRCSGARPICCWTASARTGTCVASSEECPGDREGDRLPYGCGSKADCGGYFCLFHMFEGAWCSGGDVLYDGAMCHTVADCPEIFMQTGEPFTRCVKVTDGLGRCATDYYP